MITSDIDIQFQKYRNRKKWSIFGSLFILNTLLLIYKSLFVGIESGSYEITNTLVEIIVMAVAVYVGSYIAASRSMPKTATWKEATDWIAKLIVAEIVGVAIIFIIIAPLMTFVFLALLAVLFSSHL